jgi:site-specific DNA-methyltransferase (adenine-specific)
MPPYWQTSDEKTASLYHGSALAVLKEMPSHSIHCAITSPPYWKLISYLKRDHGSKGDEIGTEPTPREYVSNMVAVCRELRRVLRAEGTFWLNMGDTYYGLRGTNQLAGIPWRLALALQADGWVLRQDVIWRKPSPMPESCVDRCIKAHEYVFLLAKQKDYYFDHEAIKVPAKEPSYRVVSKKGASYRQALGMGRKPSGNGVLGSVMSTGEMSNKRSVWSVTDHLELLRWLALRAPRVLDQYFQEIQGRDSVWTVAHGSGYRGQHFATFPMKLIEPMIQTGTSEHGCCPECGAPWTRVVKKERYPTRPGATTKVVQGGERQSGDVTGNRDPQRHCTRTVTVGWQPGCRCGLDEVVPCTVLDPFIGSGTTILGALEQGRQGLGIDLSQEYLDKQAIPRIEGWLMAHPALLHLLPGGGDTDQAPLSNSGRTGRVAGNVRRRG